MSDLLMTFYRSELNETVNKLILAGADPLLILRDELHRLEQQPQAKKDLPGQTIMFEEAERCRSRKL